MVILKKSYTLMGFFLFFVLISPLFLSLLSFKSSTLNFIFYYTVPFLATYIVSISILNLNKITIFKKISFPIFIYSILLSILLFPISNFIGLVVNLFTSNPVDDFLNNIKDIGIFNLFIIVAILPSILEEFLLRYLFLNGFKNIKPSYSAIVNGFFFGLIHLNLHQFSYTFLLGIVLTYLTIYSKNIIYPIVTHLFFNTIGLTLFLILPKPNNTIQYSNFTDKFFPILFFFVLSIFSLNAIITIFTKIKKITGYTDSFMPIHFSKLLTPSFYVVVSFYIFIGVFYFK